MTNAHLDSLMLQHPVAGGFLEIVNTPASWEEYSLEHGPFVSILIGIFVVGFIVVLRNFVFPYVGALLTKWVDARKAAATAHLDALSANGDTLKEVVEELKSFRESEQKWRDFVLVEFKHNYDRQEKILEMSQAIMQESEGTVGQKRALFQFLDNIDKLHLRIKSFYALRCKVNNIKRDHDIIGTMYTNEAEVFSGKLVETLKMYRLDGKHPISSFFGHNGAQSYVNHLMTELYNLQFMAADGDERASAITDEMLKSAFESLINRIGDDFKKWVKDPDGAAYNEFKVAQQNRYNLNIY